MLYSIWIIIASFLLLGSIHNADAAGCCSLNYKECDVWWCGSTKSSCESCGDDGFVFLEEGEISGNCLKRWSGCKDNVSGCCDGLVCTELTRYYSQCLPDDSPIEPDTPSPSLRSTNPPTPLPSLQPIASTVPPVDPTEPPLVDPPENNGKCGCVSCTQEVLERDAGGYACGARINWLVSNTESDEAGACALVGGDEFPSICGDCDPNACNQDPPPVPVESPTEPTPPISQPSKAPVDAEDQLEKIYFGGRWWRDGNTMIHSWGVGTFIVYFEGSSSIMINIGAGYEGAYFHCRVDDGPEARLLVLNSFQESEESGIAFTGLSSTEEHVIRCGRSNEASYGDTVLSGISLESGGELLQAVNPNADNSMIRFEAIGDSITAGYNVLTPASTSEAATIENQDVFQTYIRYMADAWKTTDYQVIAKSGISILENGQTGVVMPLEWPCREYWGGWEGKCPALWDFENQQADVVTINLGTNDFVYGDPTQQQFREGYLSFLQQVRANYPNALIACIEPILHSCYGENYPSLTGIVNGLEEAVKDINDPKIIYYETGSTSDQWLDCTLSTEDYVDFTHPTIQGNKKFASRLLEKMTDDVRRFFPDKCVGVGPTCGSPGEPTEAPIAAPTAAPIAAPIATPDPPPVEETFKCGCRSCTQEVLDRNADGYSCGSRIDWLIGSNGSSETDACAIVGGDEFRYICGACDPATCNNDPVYSVAHFGNSIQYYNDAPRVLEKMLLSTALGSLVDLDGVPNRKEIVKSESCLRGGSDIASLWDSGNGMGTKFAQLPQSILPDDGEYDVGAPTVKDLLRQQRWDFVVINDHTQHPARNSRREESKTALRNQYLPAIADTLEASPDDTTTVTTTIVFLQTMAYRTPVKDSGDLGSFDDFTDKLEQGYDEYVELVEFYNESRFPSNPDEQLRPTIEATVAPLGRAYQLVRENYYDLWNTSLYASDDFHPSPHGTLLEACVLHCVITGEQYAFFDENMDAYWKFARRLENQRLPTLEEADILNDVAYQVCLERLEKEQAFVLLKT